MDIKNRAAKALAPLAQGTSERSRRIACSFIFHQRKMPDKQMKKIK